MSLSVTDASNCAYGNFSAVTNITASAGGTVTTETFPFPVHHPAFSVGRTIVRPLLDRTWSALSSGFSYLDMQISSLFNPFLLARAQEIPIPADISKDSVAFSDVETFEAVQDRMQCDEHVSSHDIEDWVAQFDLEDRQNARSLLQEIDFFSYGRVMRELRSLHLNLSTTLHKDDFVKKCAEDDLDCFQSKTDKCTSRTDETTKIDFSRVYTAKSGDLISYFYRSANGIPATCFKNIGDLPVDPSDRALVILEDYVGTGSQFIYSAYAKAYHEIFNKYKTVYLVALVVNENAERAFELIRASDFETLTQTVTQTLGIKGKEQIVYQNLLNIDPDKVRVVFQHIEKKPQGVDWGQQLSQKYTGRYRGGEFAVGRTVFFYNCPNNVPPVLWKSLPPTEDKPSWSALFRRVEDVSVYPALARFTPVEELVETSAVAAGQKAH